MFKALLVAGVIVSLGVVGSRARHNKGWLVLDNNGAVSQLPPGKAIQKAFAACAGAPDFNSAVTVDGVRAVYPAPVTVCTGVTLTSQVAPDTD